MILILVLHILVALSSVGYATYVFFSPSEDKLRVSYGLIATTLFSGTYLVIGSPDHMLQSCMTGLAYTGIVSAISFVSQRRLAAAKAKNKNR